MDECASQDNYTDIEEFAAELGHKLFELVVPVQASNLCPASVACCEVERRWDEGVTNNGSQSSKDGR